MKHTLQILLACAAFASVNVVYAQTNYTVQQIPYTPYAYANDPSDSNYTILNTIDDYYSDTVSIGFDFTFFGQTYSKLLVSTNSYITFDLSQANQYSPWNIENGIPDTTPPNPNGFNVPHNAIMGPWQDIWPGAPNNNFPGLIGFTTYGVAPYRTFVLSYFEIPYYSCTTINYTGEIVLHETTNAIDVFIGHKDLCSSWNTGAAIEGIIDPSGATAYVVPGRNFPSQWTADNDGWRFMPCSQLAPTDTVTGFVYIDNNHDCVYNAGDQPIEHELVIADNCAMAYTDALGHYALVLDTGSHTLAHTVAGYVQTECPIGNSQSVSFAATNGSQSDVNFADTLVTNACTDVALLMGTPHQKLCKQNLYTVSYCNSNGTNATQPITLTVSMPDSTSIVSSSVPPASVSGNAYTFTLPYLLPGSCGWFQFVDSIRCDVTVGSTKCFGAVLSGYPDCDASNDTALDCQQIVSSFDPNAMLVASRNFSQRGFINGETISQWDSLTYQINFQNTGTAAADNIIVQVELPSSLDPLSVVPIFGSHAYVFTNYAGELHWTFTDINLPDSTSDELSSHGFVRFRVKQQPGNMPGSVIPVQAAIYFDSNPAVFTNYSIDTLLSVGVNELLATKALNVYPNPASSTVRVRCSSEATDPVLTVYNAMGQAVHSLPMSTRELTLHLENWPKGFYMLELSNNGHRVAKAPLSVQ